MCRDNPHGGRRCPHDTSAARVARRRVQKARQRASLKPLQHGSLPKALAAGVAYHDLPAIKQAITSLRERINTDPHGTDASPADLAVWDNAVEEELTTLGSVIAARAEAKAHYSREEFERELKGIEDTAYGDTVDRMNAARVAHREARQAIRPVANAIAAATDTPSFSMGNRSASDLIEMDETDVIESMDAYDKLDRLAEAEENMVTAEAAYWAADAERIAKTDALQDTYKQRLAVAYQATVAELREVGGQVEMMGASDDNARQMLESTVAKHYPTQWLGYSNAVGNMHVVNTDGRPSYTNEHEALPGETELTPVIGESWFNYGDDDAEALRPLFDALPASVLHGSTKSPDGKKAANRLTWHGPLMDPYNPAEHGELVDGRPQGAGWKFISDARGIYSTEIKEATNAAEAAEIALRPRWYQERVDTKKTVSTLRLDTREINPQAKHTGANARGIAFHEFAHRVEHVFPNNLLARQEQAFLRRRAHEGDYTRQYQDLEPLMSSPGELGHDAKMTSSYMAREYFHGRAYEVFATGIEGLYGGSYGGLSGLDPRFGRGDNEHRGFILGALTVL